MTLQSKYRLAIKIKSAPCTIINVSETETQKQNYNIVLSERKPLPMPTF